ncbi:HD domain-containing protein [Candidatus Saccharibacteria bacterium]|nr:HD domain-containing protein [Candidatus Saccharibacteria bacterium]
MAERPSILTEQDQITLDSIRNSLYNHYLPAGPEPDGLPFHNIDHALEVEATATEYCRYVQDNGKRIDEFCVRVASLLHDSGYHLTLASMQRQFPDANIEHREHYAQLTSMRLLESYGVDSARIRKVGRLILNTHKDAKPTSLEEKIVARSDVDNIAGPTRPFISNALNLIREAEILNGPQNPLERLCASEQILREIISKDLCFGDFDRAFYEQWFNQPAIANITRLGKLSVQSTLNGLIDLVNFNSDSTDSDISRDEDDES